jgi:hypothetical protein
VIRRIKSKAGIVAFVTLLALAATIFMPFGVSAASASPDTPVAAEATSQPTTPKVATGPESCGSVIAAISTGLVPAWAAAAISAPYCGSWLGAQNARYLCWQSRQWWGYSARAYIWALTWGHYTRC